MAVRREEKREGKSGRKEGKQGGRTRAKRQGKGGKREGERRKRGKRQGKAEKMMGKGREDLPKVAIINKRGHRSLRYSLTYQRGSGKMPAILLRLLRSHLP